MSSDDTNIIDFTRPSTSTGTGDSKSSELPSLLVAVRTLFLSRLKDRLSKMLDNVDDSLFELVEKSSGGAEQALYFDTMRLIRVQRDQVVSSFVKCLNTQYNDTVAGVGLTNIVDESAIDAVDIDNMTLIGDNDLEEELAIKGMVSKARSRYEGILTQLEMRFKVILDSAEEDDILQPLDPQVICVAFEEAAQELDVELKIKLIIFKLFDRHVMVDLEKMYEEVNQIFVQAGILPGTKTRRVQSRNKPSADATAADSAAKTGDKNVVPFREKSDGVEGNDPWAAAGGDGVPTEGSEVSRSSQDHGHAGAAQDAFSALQKLLSGMRQPSGTLSGAEIGDLPQNEQKAAFISTDDLLQALSVAQTHNAPGEIDWGNQADLANINMVPASKLKELITREYTPESIHGAGRLKRNDDDVIDIVSLLFEFFLDDPNLPEPIKVEIARMQIPYVKLAVVDKALFSNKKHPARLLLNEIAQAGISFSSAPNLKTDKLFTKIDHIVARVQEEFLDNPQLFDEVLEDLRGVIRTEKKRAEVVETRTKQAAEGKARVDKAKLFIVKSINNKIGKQILPGVINKILREAWSKVLFITYLKEGENSNEWQKKMQVIEDLVWSVQLKDNKQDRQRLFALIPNLLQELREGLNGILYNPGELVNLFKALEECHTRCLAQSDELIKQTEAGETPNLDGKVKLVDTAKVEAVGQVLDKVWEKEQQSTGAPDEKQSVFINEVDASNYLQVEAVPEIPSSSDLKPFVNELLSAPLESWFEVWMPTEQEQQRGKLVAKLMENKKFVFVSRAGVKLVEKTIGELAQELKDGKSKILDDSLLFDKALESVIGNLRSLRDKPLK